MTSGGESPLAGPHGTELTAYEQFLQTLHDKFPGAGIFTAILRFRGGIDREFLARLFRAVQQRHPLLRAAIVTRQGRTVYDVATEPPEIPIDWVATDDQDLWKTEAVRRARIPFDVTRPPFLRATVLSCPQHQWFDLLITMHHVIADGRAVASLLQDLQAASAMTESAAAALPVQQWIKPHITGKRGTLREAIRRFREQRAIQRQLRAIPRVEFRKLVPSIVSCHREVLSQADTTQLRGGCRLAEASLYGAMAAATLKVLATDPQQQGFRFRVDSPIDFRMTCEPPLSFDQVGCYVWILGYQIARPEEIPFWELARTCRQKLDAEWKSGSFQRTWRWLPWLLPLYKMRRTTRKKLESGIVSINDMGAVRPVKAAANMQLEELGWYSNREHTVATFVVNAVMLDGRLNLTFASPCHTSDQLAKLASAVAEQLRSAAKSEAH
ncbi:hypothetical protein GC163_09700 [bacterium]|nr:hypothetical protein [bacterium]